MFRRYGFRRASVDAIASEASVAKPTLYAYFADKDALFRAVVEHEVDEILSAARRAASSRKPPVERIADVLSAKFTRAWELVHSSPHAAELLDSQNALGAAAIAKLDREFLALLIEAIEGAHAKHVPARDLARVLLRAAAGAAYDATSSAMHRKHVAELVSVIFTGSRALAKS